MVKMYSEIVAYREQVATYERTITKLAEANAAANLEITQLREAVKLLGKELSEKAMDQTLDAVLSNPIAAAAVKDVQ